MTPQQQNLAGLGKPQPRFDLGMASYSLVKSYANRMSENIAAYPYIPWDTPAGTTYPDMPWEPKKHSGPSPATPPATTHRHNLRRAAGTTGTTRRTAMKKTTDR